MKPSNMRAMIFLIFFPYTEFNSASNEFIEIENKLLMKNVICRYTLGQKPSIRVSFDVLDTP